jgi:hypothetical protein
MTVRELLAELQRLPRDSDVLAFETACEDYCERELDEVEWQTAGSTCISEPGATSHRDGNRPNPWPRSTLTRKRPCGDFEPPSASSKSWPSLTTRPSRTFRWTSSRRAVEARSRNGLQPTTRRGVRGVHPPGLASPCLARAQVVLTERAARPSRANVRHPPPRSLARRAHSPLTACPGPRRAGHSSWRGGDAPSARAASLASSAALPVPARCHRGRGG